ncbi:MAG: hypothetical protein HC911_18080, partial [Chloroflexaceae bacterium]|nr:hypothetical protein [Chloroflexaceae bacterium]
IADQTATAAAAQTAIAAADLTATAAAIQTATALANTATPPAPPSNDNRADAQQFRQNPPIVLDVRGATIESTDPNFICRDGGTQTHTVWYFIQPSEAQEISLNTQGSTYDTIIGIWSETSTGLLQPVACNNNANSSVVYSRIDNLRLNANTRYLIGIAANDAIGAGICGWDLRAT